MNELTNHLLHNADQLKKTFHYPKNHALKIHSVYVSFIQREAMIFYVEAAADVKVVDEQIVKPLVQDTIRAVDDDNVITFILEEVLPSSRCKKNRKFNELIDELINGNTIILIEDERDAIIVETSGFKERQISEAFNESVATNRSLIRKRIKDPNLMTEMMTVGDREPQQVTIMYIQDVTNPSIIKEVKKRLSEIEIDVVLDLTILEHLIEQRPYSLIPASITTERPDRAVSFIREGHVVLLMEGSPLALIVPITFWGLIHTAEDQYLRWASGNFLRLIRFISLTVTLLVPGVYLAVTTFHPEMFPTDLMLAISASRERIPIPAFWELLFMEITFEILREAGVRIPNTIGPTIGIVGAIILGQAAVEANIVSPILVIVVAITGLASFAIPDVT